MTSSHTVPPDSLDEPLELDPREWEPRQLYFLMTALVVPRPIGWISTVSDDGIRNVAPHSYFNLVSSRHVMFSSSRVKDTITNVRATGEFVVNLVAADLAEPMNFTATDFPPEEDEFTWAGLEAAPSAVVAPPRVAAARAHLECLAVEEVQVGPSFVTFGEVVHVHVDPSVWKDGRVDPVLLDPLGRLSGSGYAELGEVFKLRRPSWADIRDTGPGEAIPRR
ncbi:MAG: flavin reductase family protein [Nitriliruptorales bacterium]|nr:flavin reductase family protein [Nitriliruptorales bacterium]